MLSRSSFLVFLPLGVALPIVACRGPAEDAPPRCVPGASIACACTTGGAGAQICQPSGTYAGCVCEPPAPADKVAAAPAAPAAAPPEAGASAPPETTAAAPATPNQNVLGGPNLPVAEKPPTLAPQPGVYKVQIKREGECIALSGKRLLPERTTTEKWEIRMAGPNAILVHDGKREESATLISNEYVLTRPSPLGRSTIKLRFTATGIEGTGRADGVVRHKRDRTAAEDCSESIAVQGTRT